MAKAASRVGPTTTRNLIDPFAAPIRLDSTSNGEFPPRPLSYAARAANHLAHERLTANAKKLGLDRRSFLVSTCAAATSLLAFNDGLASDRQRGGFYDLAPGAAFEPQLASSVLDGDEFIFDIQTHHVNPDGDWRKPWAPWNLALRIFPQAKCDRSFPSRWLRSANCFSAQHFVKEIFLDSDTDMAVLTFVPSDPSESPLAVEEAAATRSIVDFLKGSRRLLLHGRVQPNFPGEIERMAKLKEQWEISAWKIYTQFGPGGGYFLDDPKVGIPFIEKARELGVKTICVHKGLPLYRGVPWVPFLPLPPKEYVFSTCRDIGVVAKRYPDVNFIVYHSGYELDKPEGPYREGQVTHGIDTLVQSLLENDVAPSSNVYAELGTTWRRLEREPTYAAHGLGKLFKFVGEDRVLWGTDSIWYGSPQDQIQAFRSFQIGSELRDEFGYPEITPELRAKVLGLNAAAPYGIDVPAARQAFQRDDTFHARAEYAQAPEPSLISYGPQTRREFMRFLKQNGGQPG